MIGVIMCVLAIRGELLFDLRMFTIDSNLFMGIVALISCVFTLAGKGAPKWLCVLKLVATAQISITFLVVLFFLLPLSGPGYVYTGTNLIMHAITPIIAVAAFLTGEGRVRFRDTFWAILPVLVYATVYLIEVVFIGSANGGWSDIYMLAPLWPLSYVVIVTLGWGIAVLLWKFKTVNRTNRSRDTGRQ